jgi:hypothetical protein
MVVVGMAVGWWIEHRTTSTTLVRLQFIAAKLAGDLNGRNDVEVRFVKDHLYERTGASQSPPPDWWPK